MHKNVCFEVCVKFIWVLCSSVQTGNMIFITHHWREDSCGSQQDSWVDLDLKPKHQRKPWCELTTWTTCGTTFWAVWHWMYMLVCLDVGLQDTFLSWLLSIYEQLWTRSSHFAWEHVPDLGGLSFVFLGIHTFLNPSKKNLKVPASVYTPIFVLLWFGDVYFFSPLSGVY